MGEFDAELWAEIRTAFAAAVGFDMSAAGQDLAFGFACGYSAGRAGCVPLTDVDDALRDDDAYHRWRKTLTGVRPEYPSLTTRHHLADYLAERFATTTTAPEGADERNGHG